MSRVLIVGTSGECRIVYVIASAPKMNPMPFCDCRHCECRNCPDVVQKLAISIKDSKSGFRGKGAKKKKCKEKEVKRVSQTSEHRPSILDMLNPDRNCDCEIMARAIRSHIHMNMGMTERRARHSDQRPSNSKDID